MAILSEIVGFIPDVVQIFQGSQPTPEEQQKKAGTWYNMLKDFLLNDRTPEQLASIWKNQLPLKQRKTKDSVINNHILGKSDHYITEYLVKKINDELIKGGLAPMSRADILDGMGAPDTSLSAPTKSGSISPGVNAPIFDPDPVIDSGNESNMLFYFVGALMVAVGAIAYVTRPKKRRR